MIVNICVIYWDVLVCEIRRREGWQVCFLIFFSTGDGPTAVCPKLAIAASIMLVIRHITI